MKLLKLPLLVQVSIYKDMHFSQHILLTLCSGKMKSIAKCLCKLPDDVEVEISKQEHLVVYGKFNGSKKRAMVVERNNVEKEYSKVIKLGDTTMPCEINCASDGTTFITCNPASTPSIPFLTAISHSFSNLVFNFKRLFEFNFPIKTSILSMYPGDILASEIPKFYKNHPEQEFTFIESDFANHTFIPVDNPLWQIKDIMICECADGSIIRYINNFQGENAYFEGAPMDPDGLNQFLQRWMESVSRVKSIIVKWNTPSSESTILRQITTEAWDPVKRERCYAYQSRIQDYHDFPQNSFDCSDGHGIIRDRDGKRATVKVNRDYFMFLVWD